ncbi:MAG TPA: FAD-dependent oxidoreductase [Polyangia bacterium]
MNRRKFLKTGLKALGYTTGAGVLGLGGGIILVQPHKMRLPPRAPDDADRPLRSPSRKKVVVVGGGLAGLVAATELAERNFAVTLVERAPELGGKLGGWTVRALGEEFPIEHGFHGFFSQYYNLGEILNAAGAGSELAESTGYPVLFADRPPERFGLTTRLFPFNMLSVVHQSHSLHLGDFRHDGHALYDLMRFDGERTFQRFDQIDFARFAREGRINRPMVETVLEPFGRTTLNRLERLSAAEAIRFFHFYFMGNPEGLAFRYTRRDSMTAVIHPLRRRLESLGGQVRTGVGARRLMRSHQKISQVVIDADPTPAPRVQVKEDALPATGFLALPRSDGSSLFVARQGEEVIALDGHCTHMGCPVAPDPATGGFHCPCHGGSFDAEGRPTGGPPRRPLERLKVVASGAKGSRGFSIGGEPASVGEEALGCDYCVTACEVRGTRRLFAASALGEPDLERRIQSLGEADPYVVYRLWLDRPTAPGRDAFYTCSHFRYTDSLAIYSLFQEPYIDWARRTGGSVIEVHAYAIAPDALAPAPNIRAQMIAELKKLLPELASARVLHEEYQQQDNFSRFAPGDHASRPRTETPIPNLFLAGDHVRLDVPAALMEAATISGRMAANGILRAERLREIPITIVPLRGPLA